MEHRPELPRRQSSTNLKLLELESKLKEKPTPELALEYTKELSKEIAHEQLGEQEKKKEHDLAIKAMIEWSEKKFVKNHQLNTLVLKLNLLRVRHLFVDLKQRLQNIIKEEKRREEDYRAEKREEKEDEKLRKDQKKFEEDLKANAEAERKRSEKPKEAPKGPKDQKQALTPQENASDMGDNIADLTNLMSGFLSITAGGSMFSQGDQDKLKTSMLDLDTKDLSPEEFEKKLFELVDHVDMMFNKARSNFMEADRALLDVCHMQIGKDLTTWLSTGQLPRYSDADKANITDTMQNAKMHPNTIQDILHGVRNNITRELTALKGHQAAMQPAPKVGGLGKPIPVPMPLAATPVSPVLGAVLGEVLSGETPAAAGATESEGPDRKKISTHPGYINPDPNAPPRPRGSTDNTKT